MAEKHEFATLLRSSRGDAVVLLATFLLTVFRDLTEGIVVGFSLGALLFIHRMSQTTGIETYGSLAVEDTPDRKKGERVRYSPELAADPDIMIYRISGAFFFGAVAAVASVLDRISGYKALVIDFKAVPFLDSTAANAIAQIALKARRHGVRVFITGASPAVRRTLLSYGARPPQAKYRTDIASAVSEIKRLTAPADA
jgi:SulP family sulfate permease